MFINYDSEAGIAFNTYRSADAIGGELSDVLHAIASGKGCVCCSFEGAREALEDGEYLGSIDADQSAVEELHAAIREFEKEQAYIEEMSAE